MAALASSRIAVALAVLVASATANAQVPVASTSAPPAAAPAPPGYAPPGYPPPGAAPGYPPGYAPPPGYGYPPGAYAPYAAPPMTWTVVEEVPRRSTTMMGIGIALMALGGTGIIIGSSMFARGNQQESYTIPPCAPESPCDFTPPAPDTALKNGGIAVLAIGAAALVAGLPLTILGARRVPAQTKASALVPEAHGHGLRWRF
ncbi:Hypothetical protein A7982_10721 [Minicystis rosea]|nr:Hypothetical protein A7982_10721 [Minicystis rosea]